MKHTLKMILDGLMKFLSFSFFLHFLFLSLFAKKRKAFSATMQFVSLFPGIFGEWFRRGILQWITGQNLKDCCICFGCLFSDHRISIGDGVYIGSRCDLGRTEIGNDCIIGSNVNILSGKHQHSFDSLDIPIRDQHSIFKEVKIGSGTWIGNSAIIMADVGKECVVGAGSVVARPVPDFSIVGGNPAKVIKSRK